MAYDPHAKRVILHGGIRSADRVPLTDTWAWTGAEWKLLTMEGPRTIFGAAASALDSGIVLFGGHTLQGATNSTWHWTGNLWRELTRTGPSARTFPALATDVRNRRIYLIGGAAPDFSVSYTDLWYLDEAGVWTRVYERPAATRAR